MPFHYFIILPEPAVEQCGIRRTEKYAPHHTDEGICRIPAYREGEKAECTDEGHGLCIFIVSGYWNN